MSKAFLSKIFLFSSILFTLQRSEAQETFPQNGPRNSNHNSYAFLHANIYMGEGKVLHDADLLVKNGRIEFVGQLSDIPSNAVVRDLNGKWIYPSFIDLDSEYGIPSTKSATPANRSRQPQMKSNTKGAFAWNQSIKPEYRSSEDFHLNDRGAGQYRSMGFGSVLSFRHDGIMRGTSALVLTGDESDNLSVVLTDAANQLSFSKGSSRQSYPSSLMGSIALIRQTFYDAAWYAQSDEKKEVNLSLEALNANSGLPYIIESDDYKCALRADRLADEFGMDFIIRGSGDEYRRVEEIRASNARFILPMKWPLPYDLSNSYDLADMPYEKLKHWEMAPFNARILHGAGVQFSLTSRGMKSGDFWKNLRELKKRGLAEDVILNSLTRLPAEMIGAGEELGSIKTGYRANFFIMTTELFDEESIMTEHWVNGRFYALNDHFIDIRGIYNLNLKNDGSWLLTVEGDLLKPKASIKVGKKTSPVSIKLDNHEIELRFKDEGKLILMSGQVNDDESRIWDGKAQMPDGSWEDWAAIRQEGLAERPDTTTDVIDSVLPGLTLPMTAFGWDTLPEQEAILFKNATIWTGEDTGVLSNADICIFEGKIAAIGNDLNKAGIFGSKDVMLRTVSAKGQFITAGIIDEHSHIAIDRGVNEGGQASSAEVRIGDVLDPDDINIYRQLASGVTAAQLLHGSANPIGGQSALIKMRWGLSSEELKIEGADGFIKFALGENVKQSNWGDQVRIRYPQTRMGVEQVYYDHFYRAREYGEVWKIYRSGLKNNSKKKQGPIMPRRDLELDAILEILDSSRFITCHSYRQSEINMLMHVADSMGFRINTFTHILEGYKVADKMREHGAGASTFSDWWAYKFEVNDAIPYNAALMNEQGIVTAINSDDAEMARRLNQEAAKTVKYGSTSEEDAWKMVTLNPAKLLHLDQRMGSLKVGKDADVVLWSDKPLSVNARVLQTYVDGRCYFDAERDLKLREELRQERSRLIQKMADAGQTSEKQKFKNKVKKQYHCDDMEDEWDEDL